MFELTLGNIFILIWAKEGSMSFREGIAMTCVGFVLITAALAVLGLAVWLWFAAIMFVVGLF